MRISYKLALITTVGLIASAFAVTNAVAQESSIEFVEEGGTACTIATCVVHASGSSELHQHSFTGENEISACNDEFVAKFEHTPDATTGRVGYMAYANDHAVNPNTCTRVPCATTGEEAITIFDPGEGTANAGHIWVRFCVESEGGTEFHCSAEVEFDEEGTTSHHYAFAAHNEPCSLNVELTGNWENEAIPDCTKGETDVEIVHV